MIYTVGMTTGKRLVQRATTISRSVKGIAHPYRIAIIYLLAHEPMWGEDLTRHLQIKENLLMHHLKAMLQAGWITKSRDGRHMQYTLRTRTFKEFPMILSETPFWKDVLKRYTT